MRFLRIFPALLVAGLSGNSLAQSADAYLEALARSAGAQPASSARFSAERGRALFESRHGSEWSCSSCHTADPRAEGRHAVTGKKIAPLAPATNPARFADAAKAEKWFRRNCNDVLKRECTFVEKGDVLTYLASLRA